MQFGLNTETSQRADDMIRAIDANTAAIEAHTEALWATAPVKPPKPEPCSGDCKAGER